MEPKLNTLEEAIQYFSTPQNCLDYFVSRRWPNGVVCPICGSRQVIFLANQSRWQCRGKHSKRQFSAKVGTIFEDSPLGLDKWLAAMWLIANCKNGISSYEIARDLGITQKSAWFLNHRIRLAFRVGSVEKMKGELEVGETFIGGKARNVSKRKRRISLGERIASLAEKWRKETGHLSSIERKALHPAYQEIIATGARGVPYVLREMKQRAGHWFWALHYMTGVDLGSEGQTVQELRDAWLAWGRKQGYAGL